jgi:peroxiredoxin
VAISPQAVKHNRAMQEEKNLTFEILSDPGNKTADRYGIKYQMPEDLIKVYTQFGIDVPKHNGDDSWTLPLAARLIISPDMSIFDAQIGADYTVRPEPEDTLEKLKNMDG